MERSPSICHQANENRYHEVSPIFLQSDDFDPRLAKADYATKFADAEQVFQRWTVLWRSIIISSLERAQVNSPGLLL